MFSSRGTTITFARGDCGCYLKVELTDLCSVINEPDAKPKSKLYTSFTY